MKNIKKILCLVLACSLVIFAFAACGETTTEETSTEEASETASTSDVKVGFIFLSDENSTYDLNFINAAIETCEALGVEYVLKKNVGEDSSCYEACVDLVEQGCTIIFADSFGHEDYLIEAAKEYPDVEFCHATGTKAHTEGLSNYHNAFASIYEGRYLAGIVAGLKLVEMVENGEITEDEALIGYVGAYTYAEVISGYTAFFLGVKSVCSYATMEVTFTGSWEDETAEQEAATKLIEDGCVLISQHADSMGAPTACEAAGVPNVPYNVSTYDECPNTYLVSSMINWVPYYTYAIECMINGEEIATDWVGTIENGAVCLGDLNEDLVAEGTAEAIEEAMEALVSGELHVFDTSTFTVDGETLTSYLADVDTDADYTADTEAISDGYFHESEYRSAPYFDILIDGITLLDTVY